MDIHTTPLGWKVIGCAIEVHREIGPGLLESPYERALAHELARRAIPFKQQVPVPASYKGEPLGRGYRVDFVIDGELVVELKASQALVQVHRAQLRTYLRLLKVRQGLLLNFNMPRLVDGLVSVLLPDREKEVKAPFTSFTFFTSLSRSVLHELPPKPPLDTQMPRRHIVINR